MRITKEKNLISLFLLFLLPFSLLFSQSEEIAQILESNKGGIISITIYGENEEEIAQGTGFIIDKQVIATSYHLVSKAFKAEGRNYKGDKVKVEGILAFDKNIDIAFCKINKKNPALPLGDSDELEMGKKVFALGSNEASEITASEGTVRNFLNLTTTQRVVDVELSIAQSYNGAPILDSSGKVLGIIIFFDRRTKSVLPINTLKSIQRKGVLTKFKNWKQEDYFSTLEGAYFAGRICALLDETGKAEIYLKDVAKKSPDNIEVQSLLASIYNKQRNYQSAISAYKKIIELDPNRDDAHFGVGAVYFKMRRFKEAISPLEKSIQLNLDNIEAYFYIGNSYEELRDFAKAADAYEKFLELNPEDTLQAHFQLGLCLMELERHEDAIKAFEEAAKENPQDLKINYKLAQAYERAGQYENADKLYQMLAELSPEEASTYYRTILMMYDKAGITDKAIEAAKKILELNPQDADAAYNLGYMYSKQNKYNEAIDSFRKALEIRPNFEYAYANIGNSYYQMKNYTKSIEAYKKFAELAPDSPEAWYWIGVNYMQLKSWNNALEPLKRTVELRPDHAYALYNLAITYLNLHDNYSAKDIHKKLATIDSNLAGKLKKHIR
ncbi:MAG: tetratricopeptide repeat protein [Candidatus Aminicenantes bacterium]|nr:MAG: tetratricopeptide repeat protein [Candidatus Aminicenantes bacterium]